MDEERKKFLVKTALAFLLTNLEQAVEQFEYIHDDAYACVIVEGEIAPEPETVELTNLLNELLR